MLFVLPFGCCLFVVFLRLVVCVWRLFIMCSLVFGECCFCYWLVSLVGCCCLLLFVVVIVVVCCLLFVIAVVGVSCCLCIVGVGAVVFANRKVICVPMVLIQILSA